LNSSPALIDRTRSRPPDRPASEIQGQAGKGQSHTSRATLTAHFRATQQAVFCLPDRNALTNGRKFDAGRILR
jgi:hypothetical protein